MKKFIKKVMSKSGKLIEVAGDPSDPRPVEVPTALKRPESTDEKIRRIIKEQISPHAVERGFESLEESEDFDVDDDFDSELPITKAEFQEMQAEFPEQIKKLFPSRSPDGKRIEPSGSGPEALSRKELNEDDSVKAGDLDGEPGDGSGDS